MFTALSLVASVAVHASALSVDTVAARYDAVDQLRTQPAEWVALMAPVPLPALRPATLPPPGSDPDPSTDPPQLIEYSDGYFKRLTIHKWASYLTLPLFVGQYYVGSRLIDGEDSSSLRNWHGILTGSIAGLFAVNTVTGVWNAWEARKDPEGRTRRTIHSALMLLADAGFVATGALAHESEGGGFDSSDYNAHRGVAIASMATALVSYAIMLPIFRNDE